MWRRLPKLILSLLVVLLLPSHDARAQEDGSLVKGSGAPVYLIENGVRRHIPTEEMFRAMGFHWENVRTVADSALERIPLGVPFPLAGAQLAPAPRQANRPPASESFRSTLVSDDGHPLDETLAEHESVVQELEALTSRYHAEETTAFEELEREHSARIFQDARGVMWFETAGGRTTLTPRDSEFETEAEFQERKSKFDKAHRDQQAVVTKARDEIAARVRKRLTDESADLRGRLDVLRQRTFTIVGVKPEFVRYWLDSELYLVNLSIPSAASHPMGISAYNGFVRLPRELARALKENPAASTVTAAARLTNDGLRLNTAMLSTNGANHTIMALTRGRAAITSSTDYFRALIRGTDSRWIDHGNGAVTDTVTGLTWTKECGPRLRAEHFAGQITWIEAMQYAAALRVADHDDWRLPTLDEAKSVVIGGGELLQHPPFEGCLEEMNGYKNFELRHASHWWTSTRTGPANAYAGDGNVFDINKRFTLGGFAVYAVRNSGIGFSDESLWAISKSGGFSRDYETYLNIYPQGKHAVEAKSARARLRKVDAVLTRLTESINREYRQYAVSLSYKGFKDGVAYITINRASQGLGTLMDIVVTGSVERVATRNLALGEFTDGVRATFLQVPGVERVFDGGEEMTGKAAKPWQSLLRLAQQVGYDEAAAVKIIEKPTPPSSSKRSAAASKPAAARRVVEGTARFKTGAIAANVCDLTVWTKDSSALGSLAGASSHAACTDASGRFHIAVDDDYVIEIHWKGRKVWRGSNKIPLDGRAIVDVTFE